MYNIGEIVLYSAEGVCKIVNIAEKCFAGQSLDFYELQTIGKRSITIFVPVNNKKQTDKMRKILSPEEIHAMIDEIQEEDYMWIDDDALRKEEFKKVLHSGNRKDIMILAKTLQTHQVRQEKKGKKLHISDEQYLKTASRILLEEFSHVFQMSLDDVPAFIENKINPKERDTII